MGAQARVTVMTKSPRVVSNLTWNVSGACSVNIVGRSRVLSLMAAAADFPAPGAVGFGFAGACVGVCANVCIVSQNNPTRIAAANFRIVVPSLLLESKGLLPDQFPADTLHFGHDAQGIFSQNLLYVIFGITFFQECVGDFRKLGGVFHAIWHVSAIEIRTQPHVI